MDPRIFSGYAPGLSGRPEPYDETQFMFVSCYTQFEILAHRPKGTPNKHGIWVFLFEPSNGKLTLFSVLQDPDTLNPAFMRYHPHENVLYAVTESVKEEGILTAYGVSPNTGALRKLGEGQGCGGTSTCFITTAFDVRHLLVVNYWNSTLGSLPIDDNGIPGKMAKVTQAPKVKGGPAVAPKQHGDDPHGKHRMEETHAHAIVLDPALGRVAYVPDLGEDLIKQFTYSMESGELQYAGSVPANNLGKGPHGPRYIEFHPVLNVAYVVNELGSTVSVFEFDEMAAGSLTPENQVPTLMQVQQIETLPSPAFPLELNTCGRIAVSPSGNHVVVSNRGHDSLVVYSVKQHMGRGAAGRLTTVGFFHTMGNTPRHFQFDCTGRWLISANQDSDHVAVFSFDDAETGELEFKWSYKVPSPNFITMKTPHPRRTALAADRREDARRIALMNLAHSARASGDAWVENLAPKSRQVSEGPRSRQTSTGN